MKPYELLRANERLSRYNIFSDKDKFVGEDLDRMYPDCVSLSEYYGDWGLGRSRIELRFNTNAIDYDAVDMALVRWNNKNNPIGPSPGIVEFIDIDGIDKAGLRRLRDYLNSVLDEGNSDLEGDQ